MAYCKKLELVPKETKAEVLRRHFGEQYDLMKKYDRFQECNEDEFMKAEVNIGICPVCGKQIEEYEKTKAIIKLMGKLAEGEKSAKENGWLSNDDVKAALGV